MRVLEVTSGYPPVPGGVENSVYELVTRLRALNHDVRVITAGVTSRGLEDRVWRLPIALKVEKSWGDIFFCPSILRAIDKTPFELVHAHTPRKLFAEAVSLYKLLSRRKFPYIVSIRLLNASLPGFARGFATVYQKLVEQNVFRNAKYVIVQTKANRQFIIEKCGVEPDRIHIVPNAVDIRVFDPDSIDAQEIRRKHGLEEGKIVLFVGRLTGQKGLTDLLHAIPSIERIVPSVRFLIAGSGPQEELLKREAAMMQTRSRVVFIGNVKHEKIHELYSVADVFVLPSLSESFPNAMLEAMAMRNPVVTTRVGVAPEILENRETGLLIKPGDAVGLAEAITELLTDQNLSRKIGQKALELVRANYSWEKIVDQTLILYKAALN